MYGKDFEQHREDLIAIVDQIANHHPNVVTGEVQWYGGGDEGSVQGSYYYSHGHGEVDVDTNLAGELEEQIEEWVELLYPGWVNNEGGSGCASIDFAKRTVSIEHNYIEEVSTPDSPVVIGETVKRYAGLRAEKLPEGIDVTAIAEDSLQAAFKVIADSLEAAGYPVTGDIAPSEAFELEYAFKGYVHQLALNNNAIATLNEREVMGA